MKIVFATPIYPPEIGGPAIYAKNLKEGLEKKGNIIEVVSYQGLKKFPQPLRIFLYFLRLFRNAHCSHTARNCDLIYAFNLMSCGLPAYFCQKKFVVRIGGDYLWERAVEAGRTKKPLREYYQSPKTLKEKFWTRLIKKILKEANKIIFTSNFQKEIYIKYFGILKEKTIIIPNPFPEMDVSNRKPRTSNFILLYAGRLLKLKNLDFLIEVFKKVQGKTDKSLTLKIIGEGPEKENLKLKTKNLKLEGKVFFENPLPHQKLLKEIQKSYLCVLPSLTEITPNFALECIKSGKPILLTRETGLFENFKDNSIFIDPKNETDLEEKVLYLLDEKNYLDYIEKIKKIPTNWRWENVIREHEKSLIY